MGYQLDLIVSVMKTIIKAVILVNSYQISDFIPIRTTINTINKFIRNGKIIENLPHKRLKENESNFLSRTIAFRQYL